ncbi:MAG: hypothetical protein K9L30_07150 [Desulfobacterales bacterium]|nr:hypothetical protein [Desulfobacterales bacterium]
MNINVTGGGFVTISGWGKLGDKVSLHEQNGTVSLPEPKLIFPEIPKRWGRFDNFTRMGCTAAALALQDASYHKNSMTCGMVISTLYDTIITDRDYYQTTLEDEGAMSSPNLFSYTLPVIVLGESCVSFDLRGPTFCVGDHPETVGMDALKSAVRMIRSEKSDRMLAGVVENPPADLNGCPMAFFIVLEKSVITSENQVFTLKADGNNFEFKKNKIGSILDFFNKD